MDFFIDGRNNVSRPAQMAYPVAVEICLSS
jgi:hypothetical protein